MLRMENNLEAPTSEKWFVRHGRLQREATDRRAEIVNEISDFFFELSSAEFYCGIWMLGHYSQDYNCELERGKIILM